MKIIRPLFPALLCLCLSCISVSFVGTGSDLPPLAPGAEVKVFLSKIPPGEYKEIGVITVRGGNMERRIVKAKEEARKHGGDGLLPKDTRSETSVSSNPGYGYTPQGQSRVASSTIEIQEFIVIKLVEPKKEETKDLPGDSPNAAEYGALPRAGFSSLLNDYESLREKKFRGSLYPVNFFSIPAVLKKHAGDDRYLVMMSSSTGKSNLLLLVPKAMEGNLREMIETKEALSFVYSPVDVYRTKAGKSYPVLMFVDKIEE